MKKYILLLAVLGLTACGDDDSSTPAAVTAPPSSIDGAIDLSRQKLGELVPDTSEISTASLNARTAFGNDWEDGNYALGGDFGNSPRNFVRAQGDEDAQSNLMFRLDQMMDNLCIFNVALPNTDGVPDLSGGNQIVTLTAAVKQQIVSECGVSSGDLPPDDTDVGYYVSDISGETDSMFQREAGFDMSGGTSFHSFFRFTISDSVMRMSYIADEGNVSAGFLEYDVTAQVFRFEFSEEAAAPFALHFRGTLQDTTNLGRFVAIITDKTDTSSAVVSINEGNGDQVHVSYSYDDDADTNDLPSASACISGVDMSIAADDATSCSNGITGADVADVSIDMTTIISGTYFNSLDETTFIQFSDFSDIMTAAAAN